MTLEELQTQLEELEALVQTGSDYTLAESRARELLAQHILANTPELHCRILLVLSESLRQRGMSREALPYAEECLSLAERKFDEDLSAKAFRDIGIVHYNLADYTKALEYYNRALAVHEAMGDRSGIARVTVGIGNVHDSLADYPKALAYYNRALALYEEMGDKSGRARVTGNIGTVHMSLADYPKALEYLNRALATHEELGEKSGIARVTGNIGIVYFNLTNYPTALETFYRALAMQEELGDRSGSANTTGNIGNVFAGLSDYSRALEYCSRALAVHEELGERSYIAGVTGNIGVLYENLADYPKALEYFDRALAVHEELGERSGIARVTGNIGTVHTNLADYPKALVYFSRALAMHEELGEKSWVAVLTRNIGEVYRRMEDYPRALEYLNIARDVSIEIGAKANLAQSFFSIGRVLTAPAFSGYDVVQAERYLLEAIHIHEELGTQSEKSRAHRALAELYEQENRWEEFAIHYKNYHHIDQTVHSEEAKKQAALIEQQKQVAEREKSLALERAAAEATTALLHKVLPSSVAERLIKGENIADYFQSVSILFADIVGFTPIAARMQAEDVLTFLNYVFGAFDAIMERHGCQKIKTIGDGYMAVAGAPVTCDDHAERLARAALDLIKHIALPDTIRTSLPANTAFHLRIGLHTGAAFAGIVGEKGFVYDVYSDAVNLASRMESSSEAGRIHCSEDFARHVQKRDNSFVFVERGEIEIKGKGQMRTYFLLNA